MLFRLGTRARLGLQLALTIVLSVSALGNSAVLAHHDHDDHDDDKSQAVHQWDAELAGLPPKAEKHRGPLLRLAKGVGKELAYDVTNMARDSVFVFSAQDNDASFEGPAPANKGPHTIATFNLVDGSVGKLVKYPDGSGRVFGGYIDETVLIPDGDHRWIVKYPNGVQGVLRKAGGVIEVMRPDKTITTFTRQGNGGYRVSNDHIGYMGDIKSGGSSLDFGYR